MAFFYRRLAAVLLASVISTASQAADGPTTPVRIGALLSLTGNWSSLGLMSQTLLGLAGEDVNAYLAGHGSDKRVEVLVRDTQLDPNLALDKFQHLIRQGAVAVIGPQSSAEVAELKALADSAKVPLLSQGSTASSLAIAGDMVYRLVPDDSHESEAMAALLLQRGVQVVVPVWRDDPGNDGLEQSLQARMQAAGVVMLPGVRYSTDTQDFAAVAEQAAAQVNQALRRYRVNSVAVYLAGFDEVVSLFHEAAAIPVLQSVKWYGSDGVALSNALLADSAAAQFAMAVDYPNPTVGLPEAAKPKWQALSDRIYAQTGQQPDAFALAAYDALWLAALNAAYRPHIQQHADTDILAQTADLQFGATGWTALNEAGDRQQGDYDFWALRQNADDVVQWVSVCRYDTTSGSTPSLTCSGE